MHQWRTCDRAGTPTLFACGELYALRAWYCLRQWYALRAFEVTKANIISLRPSGAISLLRSKNITPSCARHITKNLFRLTVHLKGVTHYTLWGKACEKEYEQTVRTPFLVGAFFERPRANTVRPYRVLGIYFVISPLSVHAVKTAFFYCKKKQGPLRSLLPSLITCICAFLRLQTSSYA